MSTPLPGTILAAKITPGNTSVSFATHEDVYGQGGLRTVTTYNDLTNITTERQKEGMLVFVKDENKYYALSSTSFPLTSITSNFYIGFSDYLKLSGGVVRGDVTFQENISAGKIVYTSQYGNSINWSSVYTSVKDTSANWDTTYTSVKDTSANWDSTQSSVYSTSGSWNSTYSTVNNLSSDWSAWRSMALLQDMSQFQTATEKTSGGNVIGYLRDGTPSTLPANTPYPLYRLSTPNASPREYTDLAVVRGNFNNTVPYFTGNIRGQVDFQRPIEVYIRVASPIAGTGIFQFGLGYGFNLNLGSLTVGNDFPDFPDTGIGFRLGRAQGPGISSLSASLITKPTGGVTGPVQVINSTSSLTIPLTTANYFLLRYLPTGYLGLYLIKNGNENLLVEHNHGTTYTLQTSSHNVNWFAGINPKDTIGGMTYDIEPPKILYSI
jgi:hypothetical protein